MLGTLFGSFTLMVAYAIHDIEYATPLTLVLFPFMIMYIGPAVMVFHAPLFLMNEKLKANKYLWMILYSLLGGILGLYYAKFTFIDFHWVYAVGGVGSAFFTWLSYEYLKSKYWVLSND